MKPSDEIRWGRSLAITGIMILLVVAASFFIIHRINQLEESESFERLYEEAGNLVDRIETYSDNDREELELLSSVIAHADALDSAALWDLLDSHTSAGMMSRFELLLPDDTVLVSGGKRVDASGVLSFAQESALGAHISNRESDLLDPSNYIVRHYVPVTRAGETVAMLCGVIELGELPDYANLAPYGGRGAMYIIDGSTGDFLVDTWHSGEGGNIWALGKREMAPGYDSEQMPQGLIQGESRYVVFVSQTTGEYLYFYYTPLAINQWRVAVSVPESVVFEQADAIERILNQFLLVELVCFLGYFLWMIRYARQVTGEKQRRLETLNYIYTVEKLLFNAHETKDHLFAALEQIGAALPAERVDFWMIGQDQENTAFFWRKGQPGVERREPEEPEQIRRLADYFQAGNSEFEAYDEASLRALFPEGSRPEVRSILAVPVEDLEGTLCGILAACNLSHRQTPAALLKNLKFSFSMFCRNRKHYTELQEQGDRDALTELYNRNRYERDLIPIAAEYQSSLTCVYIDVNGLHEMNNTSGHASGDQMLQSVAEGIRSYFDTQYAYRTGGDEFILFLPGAQESDVTAQCQRLTAFLAERDYHISVGIQYEAQVPSLPSLQELIKKAESKMYAEKKRYYEQSANDRRRTARS